MIPILDVAGLYLTQGDDNQEGSAAFSLAVPSFTLFPGDLICVAGPSGSGKSTFLDTVALLSGARKVERFMFWPAVNEPGLDLAAQIQDGQMDCLAHYRSTVLGYAPQAGGMLPFLSAWDDAMSPVTLGGRVTGGEEENRLRDYAERLGLGRDLGKSRAALSGGQRKRLSLLRALARPRRLLVLDEPTAGVDEATAESALRLVADVARQQGTACLIASHDVELACKVGFRLHKLQPVPQGGKGKGPEARLGGSDAAGRVPSNSASWFLQGTGSEHDEHNPFG